MKRSSTDASRMRWRIALLALAGVAAVFALGMALPGGVPAHTVSALHAARAGSTTSGALDPRVARLARHQPARRIEAIVQFKARVSPTRAIADARRAHAKVLEQLDIIHGLAVELTAGRARHLAHSRDVHALSLNASVTVQDGNPDASAPDPSQLQTTFDQSLNAPALWQMGGTGARVGVAVIDTGIDGQLPDFRSARMADSRVIATAVANPQAHTVMDTYGHGTDVAGIVAGNGASRDSSDPLWGQYIGVAPNANLISVKVSDDQGNATVLDVINGLEFVIDQQHRYDIRVVNLSLDSTTAQSYQTDPLDAAVEAAWFHGIVVVAAAGNRGQSSDAVQYAPANDPFVITVGGVDENGTPDTSSHTIADWSSRGITQDGFAKPDVYAPGAHIVSDLAPGSAFATFCDSCIIGGQYIRASGTSLAAPMVSGLVADVLALHHNWTPNQVKGALTSPASWSDGLPEIDGVRLAQLDSPPSADQNLAASQLLDASTGNIDYSKSSWSKSSWSKSSWSKSSWSKSSWSVATGTLSADFAKSSWSCSSCADATAQVGTSSSLANATSWGTDGFR
jgi:serine protease AprX